MSLLDRLYQGCNHQNEFTDFNPEPILPVRKNLEKTLDNLRLAVEGKKSWNASRINLTFNTSVQSLLKKTSHFCPTVLPYFCLTVLGINSILIHNFFWKSPSECPKTDRSPRWKTVLSSLTSFILQTVGYLWKRQKQESTIALLLLPLFHIQTLPFLPVLFLTTGSIGEPVHSRLEHVWTDLIN